MVVEEEMAAMQRMGSVTYLTGTSSEQKNWATNGSRSLATLHDDEDDEEDDDVKSGISITWAYAFIKLIELIFESIPESILQGSVLMMSDEGTITPFNVLSLASSILAAGRVTCHALSLHSQLSLPSHK